MSGSEKTNENKKFKILTKKFLLREYIKKEKSINKIASEVGCSQHPILYWLRKFNIPRRFPKNDDISGKKFGKLLLIKKTSKGKWLCQCECGNIKEIARHNFESGTTYSCGCYKKSLFKNNSKWFKGYKDITGVMWCEYKHGAKSRNLKFEISLEYAWEILEKQNKKCYFTGVELTFPKKCSIENEHTASIDRISPLLGYVEGNIQWIDTKINRMKWDMEQDYFIDLAIKIHKNYNKSFSKYKNKINLIKITNPRNKGLGNIYGKTWNDIKYKALLRKIDFNIEIEYAWNMYLEQKGLCALSKSPINFSPSYKIYEKTASLDRIDNNEGYVKGNVHWVHKDVNKMKHSYSMDYLLYICSLIYKKFG